MANKKPLWQRKNVTHEVFENEAREIKKEIDEIFERIGDDDELFEKPYTDLPDDLIF